MAIDLSNGFFSSPTRGITHFFTDTQNTTERVEEKNKQTNKHGLGLAPRARRGNSMWHFCAALLEFVGYRWRVFCAELPQNQKECWLISWMPCFHILIASFYWLCPSLNNYLKPTVLFCPPLSPDSLCLLWDLPSLFHFRSRGGSRPQAHNGFRAKADKEILWPVHTHQHNEWSWDWSLRITQNGRRIAKTNPPCIKNVVYCRKNYTQIEKEALGIIFAATKFHRFIYRRHFILKTHQKPLLMI